MLLAHNNASLMFSIYTSQTLLPPILPHFVSLYHLFIVHLFHVFILSAPPFYTFYPLLTRLLFFLFLSFSFFFAIVSSVRRGPVFLSSLSPQARVVVLFCLQPLPKTRVKSLRSAQPPTALLFLQQWAVFWPLPTQYPFTVSPFLSEPITRALHRPWPSRHPRGGRISS